MRRTANIIVNFSDEWLIVDAIDRQINQLTRRQEKAELNRPENFQLTIHNLQLLIERYESIKMKIASQ